MACCPAGVHGVVRCGAERGHPEAHSGLGAQSGTGACPQQQACPISAQPIKHIQDPHHCLLSAFVLQLTSHSRQWHCTLQPAQCDSNNPISLMRWVSASRQPSSPPVSPPMWNAAHSIQLPDGTACTRTCIIQAMTLMQNLVHMLFQWGWAYAMWQKGDPGAGAHKGAGAGGSTGLPESDLPAAAWPAGAAC